MAEWDLFLDESGRFEGKNEHTLIGGVLIPHESYTDKTLFARWIYDIRRQAVKENILTADKLNAGDEWHKLKERQRLSVDDDAGLGPRYVFDHCSENVRSPERVEIQNWILGEFCRRINSLGGCPVVFDNTGGVYQIDSNTTFMSIFANGTVRLYNDLRTGNPGKKIYLYIHAASRLNVTRKYYPDQWNISPAAGNQSTLDRDLYLNMVRSCVFLNGGHQLLELEEFQSSLESFEIVEDITDANGRHPHPATVLCDYVCNSSIASGNALYKKTLENGKVRVFNVFDGPLATEDYSLESAAQSHEWGKALCDLISKKFPSKRTEEFRALLSQDVRYNQLSCVNTVIEYLKPFIANREDMDEWLTRLELINEKCVFLENEAYTDLKANVLLYEHTLYTHLGKTSDVTRIADLFVETVARIRELTHRDALLMLFCNRQIVFETDLFNYQSAQAYFQAAKKYYENRAEGGDNLLVEMMELTGREIMPDTVINEYGKCLGSYIQLLTKMIRFSKAEERQALKEAADWAVQTALSHYEAAADINRWRQNVCDLYVEEGKYREALEYLCKSLGAETSDSFEKTAQIVLEKCGVIGEKNKFACLHYMYLMHRCMCKKAPEGKLLLDCMLQVTGGGNVYDSLAGKAHPEGVILWHIAASLARGGVNKKYVAEMFENAHNALAGQGYVFDAIAIAIKAEYTALALDGLIADNNAQRRVDSLFAEYERFKARGGNDPFADILTGKSAQHMYKAAEAIVY